MLTVLSEEELYELDAGTGNVFHDLGYLVGYGFGYAFELMTDNASSNKYSQPLYGNW